MNKQERKRALDYLSKMTPMQRSTLIDDLTGVLKSGGLSDLGFRQSYAKSIDAALSMTAEKAISEVSFLDSVYREIKKKEKRERAAESKRATEARAREMARAVNTATRKQGKQP